MATLFTSPRLRFRTYTAADEALLGSALNTPQVTKQLGGVLARAEQAKLFTWLSDEQANEYGHTFWPIELKKSGEFIGICGLVTVDEEDSTVLGATELGYRIKSDAQGKGYAKEAAARSLKYAFEIEKTWRVVSRTTIENGGSWGVMRAVGMRHDPRLDYISDDGTAFIVHVMTHGEWAKSGRQTCELILDSQGKGIAKSPRP